MSKISLKHSGGNVVSLNSPTSAPTSADVAFKLPNADGTSGQVLKTDGSGNLSFGADTGGKILQVVVNEKSDTVSISGQNNNGSFGTVTGINVTITPTAASSKILVQFCLGKVSHDSNSTGVRFTRSVAGGTAAAIKVADAAGSRQTVSSNIFGTGLINTGHAQAFNYQFVDTPSYSVGQAIVYQMQVQTEGSGNFYVNRTHDDTNNANIHFARAFSTITATEVAA